MAHNRSRSALLLATILVALPVGWLTAAAWACWREGGTSPVVSFAAAGTPELVTAIRETGAKNIIIVTIIVTGNNYGSQLDGCLQYRTVDHLNQLITGWHTYGDGFDCQDPGCWQTTLANVLNSRPVVATEIGELDCRHDYVDRIMSFLDIDLVTSFLDIDLVTSFLDG